jgi:hypothetical protein
MILDRAKKSREIALGPYNSTPLYTKNTSFRTFSLVINRLNYFFNLQNKYINIQGRWEANLKNH